MDSDGDGAAWLEAMVCWSLVVLISTSEGYFFSVYVRLEGSEGRNSGGGMAGTR